MEHQAFPSTSKQVDEYLATTTNKLANRTLVINAGREDHLMRKCIFPRTISTTSGSMPDKIALGDIQELRKIFLAIANRNGIGDLLTILIQLHVDKDRT